METFAAFIIGLLLGAGITLWTQAALRAAEGSQGNDQRTSDDSYLD